MLLQLNETSKADILINIQVYQICVVYSVASSELTRMLKSFSVLALLERKAV